ncbi:MAG: PD-(D/E)XK nuclease family protein [Nitrospiraceae bacterium]
MSVLNNTAFTKYENCPRLFYLEEVLRYMRVPQDGEAARSIDREQGILWHELMDLWRRPGLASRDDRLELVAAHIKTYYNARIAAAQFEEERLFEIECERYMQALFDAYVAHYPVDSYETVDTERDFITCLGDECPTCGEPYHEDLRRGMTVQQTCQCGAEIDYLVGRVDVIAVENGVVKIGDYKTKKATAAVSHNTLSGFAVGSQFTTYMYGTGRALARTVANGFVDIVVKLKNIAEKGNPFKRNDEIVKGPIDYEMFVADRREILRQIRDDLARLDENGVPQPGAYPFRRNTNHCYQYGPCPMLDFCHPSRHTWWTVPAAKTNEFTIRPANYVDDYRALIAEEIE